MNERVLIIDDDKAISSLLQEALEDEGYKVDTAHDGLTAWKKLTHQLANYKVVLLDLNIPQISGLQLIEALQQRDKSSLHSIVVLSADTDACQQAARRGIPHVLEKPFELDPLLELISNGLT